MQYVNEEDRIKREASVPVSTRVDVRSLAEVCNYFLHTNVPIRTMSQLVSWSVEMLLSTLRANDRIGDVRPTIENSYAFLHNNGLVQQNMMRKLSSGMAFENLRVDGSHPAIDDAIGYNRLHNNNNWSGGVNDQRPYHDKEIKEPIVHGRAPSMSVAQAQAEAKRLNKEYQQKVLKAQADAEMERINSAFPKDKDNCYIIPETENAVNGPAYKEDIDKSKAEQEERDRIHKEKMDKEKLDRKKDKLKKDLAEIDEEEEDDSIARPFRPRPAEVLNRKQAKRDKEKEEELNRMI